jgi:hypothetical protein
LKTLDLQKLQLELIPHRALMKTTAVLWRCERWWPRVAAACHAVGVSTACFTAVQSLSAARTAPEGLNCCC